MSNAELESEIEAAWSERDSISSSTTGKARDAIAVSYTHLRAHET